MFNYGIGGTEAKRDSSEAFADIPQNRTLLVEHLTDQEPLKADIVHGLQNTADIFKHFKPEKEVEFINEQGNTIAETLHFAALEHFGIDGITTQSEFLQKLNNRKVQHDNLARQVKGNKALMTVLNDPNLKKDYLAALNALIQELEEAK